MCNRYGRLHNLRRMLFKVDVRNVLSTAELSPLKKVHAVALRDSFGVSGRKPLFSTSYEATLSIITLRTSETVSSRYNDADCKAEAMSR